MRKISWFVCVLCLVQTLCFTTITSAKHDINTPTLLVPLINHNGESIGTVQLHQRAEKLYIAIDAEQLPPGKHAIHIHNVGLCEAPDFKSAEGHFNPNGKKHGFHAKEGFHSGDLPNIEVGADGTVKTEIVSTTVTLVQNNVHSLLKPGGTSIIIHQHADDYLTDPSGNSGDRIACGVIQ